MGRQPNHTLINSPKIGLGATTTHITITIGGKEGFEAWDIGYQV